MATDRLSLVFGALADPTRRAILTRLADGEATVAELAAPFSVSQPAISRHLKVLENAGLISRTRRATARLSHLEAEPLREVTTWLARYQRFWDESHERLDDLLAALQARQDDEPRPRPRRPQRRETTMSKTQITAEPGIPQIIITREFDAPRDLVFRAHIEPELLAQWLGPRDLTHDHRPLRRPRRRHLAVRPHRRRTATSYGFHGVFHGDPSPGRHRADLRVRRRAGPRRPRRPPPSTSAAAGRWCARSRPSSRSRTVTRWSPPVWNAASVTPTTAWTELLAKLQAS